MDFEKITLRLKVSHRGGGIKISLDKLGYPNEKMTAYQNYLGGGMLGSIHNDCTIELWSQDSKLCEIANKLSVYYFNISNNEDDEYTEGDFEELQKRPVSAY